MERRFGQQFWPRFRRGSFIAGWISLLLFAVLQLVAGFLLDPTWAYALRFISLLALVLTALSTFACVVASVVLWWLKGPVRWGVFAPRARKAHLLALYDEATSAVIDHNLALVRVLHVYQVARRGTKCLVEHRNGAHQDAWFWNFNPKRGCVFLVRAHSAYGPHNSNMQVMYVGSEVTGSGVVGGLPTAAWRAARKRAAMHRHDSPSSVW